MTGLARNNHVIENYTNIESREIQSNFPSLFLSNNGISCVERYCISVKKRLIEYNPIMSWFGEG